MKQGIHRRLISMLCLLAIFFTSYAAQAAEDDTAWLECEYRTIGSVARNWSFPYNDSWFESPASVYNHALAQSSLGLALASHRNLSLPPEQQGREARRYLSQAGFDRLVSEGYNAETTAHTISTIIASKKINGFTLVAVAICGFNYQNEWQGNFQIDDNERHTGFNEAAQKVNARVRRYLESEAIQGEVKLWSCGYSRAGAVSNLASADFTESGLFSDVFSYNFAAPNAAKSVQRDFDNIFNVLGKFDPIPLVPFREWGYKRYGIDLYTPAQETDSDYYLRKQRADAVSLKLMGEHFWNNLQINSILHTIFDFLLDILPTSAVYRDHAQKIFQSVMANPSLENLQSVLNRLLDDTELVNDKTRPELESLLDFLSMAVYTTAAGSLSGQTSWNSKAGLTGNLMHEHSPDTYLSWMFSSDDPAEIFTDKLRYLRVTYDGEVTASILGDDGFVFAITPEGQATYANNVVDLAELEDMPFDRRPQIPLERKGTQNVLTIPKDTPYYMTFNAETLRNMVVFGTHYTVGQLKGRISKIRYIEVDERGRFLMSFTEEAESQLNGEDMYFTDRSEDMIFSPFSEDEPYSPSLLAALENHNVFHLTWRQMLYIAIGIAALLVAGITAGTVAIVKKVRRRRNLVRAERQ